jgi:hypothetical protein
MGKGNIYGVSFRQSVSVVFVELAPGHSVAAGFKALLQLFAPIEDHAPLSNPLPTKKGQFILKAT